jgi:hypothetical protein
MHMLQQAGTELLLLENSKQPLLRDRDSLE